MLMLALKTVSRTPYRLRSKLPFRNNFSMPKCRYLSTNEYHEISDETLEAISESYEKVIDLKPEVDVDLSHGVLTLVMPPAGTYVINKQPPNLQIWLSSPISGPKRYEWDDASRKWVYFRDNTTLGQLLKDETKHTLDITIDLEVE